MPVSDNSGAALPATTPVGPLPVASADFLLQTMPCGALALAPDGTVAVLNPGAEDLWDVPTAAVLGHAPAQVQPSVLPPELLQALATTGEVEPAATYWLPHTQQWIEVRVLILSMEEHALSISQVLDAGALGYVLKNADKSEILVAIQAVAVGKRFLFSELGLMMLDKLLAAPATTPAPAKPANELSQREREVLQLVANGLTNQEMADKLFTSKRTMETHRQNILEKTGAKNTAALVRYAASRGWLTKE